MMRVWSTGIACCVLAAAAFAQGDLVLQQIADARRLHESGRSEDAALSLHAARNDLVKIEDAAVRRRLERSIGTLLDEVDPLEAATSKAREAAARLLLKPAQGYARRKWFRAALPVLEEVAELSGKIGDKPLEEAHAALGGGGARGPDDAIDAWFGDGKSFAGGGYWKVQKGIIESPAISTDSVGFRSERRATGAVRIAVEALASAEPSKASLVFAMDPSVNGDDYYILELRHVRGYSQMRLLHNAASGTLDEIVTQYVTFSRAERADWIEIEVELRLDRIRIEVGGGIESAETRSVTPDLDGCIGLFVSGDSPLKTPVRFRSLRVEKL